MSFNPAQKADFKRDGFLHLPGAISAEQLENALHAIYHRLGQGVPAEELRTWQQQSFFPDLQTQPVITDLFNDSQLRPILQNLMGEENVAPARAGQLALRFPRELGAPIHAPGPHIDGVHSSHNGVPKGTIASFSALIGVFLTDVDADNAGNFTGVARFAPENARLFSSARHPNYHRRRAHAADRRGANRCKSKPKRATRFWRIINCCTASRAITRRARVSRRSFASNIRNTKKIGWNA